MSAPCPITWLPFPINGLRCAVSRGTLSAAAAYSTWAKGLDNVLVLVRRGNEQAVLAEFPTDKVKLYDEQLSLSSPSHELWRGMGFLVFASCYISYLAS
jgi:hypothetical protein